jgi:hypothetical protein
MKWACSVHWRIPRVCSPPPLPSATCKSIRFYYPIQSPIASFGSRYKP